MQEYMQCMVRGALLETVHQKHRPTIKVFLPLMHCTVKARSLHINTCAHTLTNVGTEEQQLMPCNAMGGG